MSLPVLDFISRLIRHIPDKNFRNIRYYGFLSHKLRGELLPVVYKLLDMESVTAAKVYITWHTMIQTTYNYDPMRCPQCKNRYDTTNRCTTYLFPSRSYLETQGNRPWVFSTSSLKKQTARSCSLYPLLLRV